MDENADPNLQRWKEQALDGLEPFYAAVEAGRKVCTCGAAKACERERAHCYRLAAEARTKQEAALALREEIAVLERKVQERDDQVRSRETELAGEANRLAVRLAELAAREPLDKAREKLRVDRCFLDVRQLEVEERAAVTERTRLAVEQREADLKTAVQMQQEISDALTIREQKVQEKAATLEQDILLVAMEKERLAEREKVVACRETTVEGREKALVQREHEVVTLEKCACADRHAIAVDEKTLKAEKELNGELKASLKQQSEEIWLREETLKKKAVDLQEKMALLYAMEERLSSERAAVDLDAEWRTAEHTGAMRKQEEACERAAADLATRAMALDAEADARRLELSAEAVSVHELTAQLRAEQRALRDREHLVVIQAQNLEGAQAALRDERKDLDAVQSAMDSERRQVRAEALELAESREQVHAEAAARAAQAAEAARSGALVCDAEARVLTLEARYAEMSRALEVREHEIEQRYLYVKENEPLIARYREQEKELELRRTCLDLQEDSFAKAKEACESNLEDKERAIEHLGETLRNKAALQRDREKKLELKERMLQGKPFDASRHPSLR